MEKKFKKYVVIGGGLLNFPELNSLTDEQIIERYNRKEIPYPYIKYFTTPQTIKKRFDNLKNYRYKIIDRNYKLHREIDIPEQFFKYKDHNGELKKKILLFSPENYLKYDLISDYFQESIRLKCRRIYEDTTPLNYFYDLDSFKNVLKKTRNSYEKIDAFTLRMGLFDSIAECSAFRPTIIVSFIKMFKSKRILDISAGWGDRLIGSMAMDVDYYFAVDPNHELHEGYQNMISFFDKSTDRYVVKKDQFEKVKIEFFENKKFDLVMTSPPYFNFEIYTDDSKQSIFNIDSTTVWLNKFMYPSLIKAWDALESSGKFVLNINNKSNDPKDEYVGKIVKYINGFSDSDYKGCISYAEFKEDGKLRNPQPVWIWFKK